MTKRAVFLDRDGTLISDTGYLRDPRAVRLLPNVVESLHELRRAGFLLVVVSNQSGVGRGLISTTDFDAVHRAVMRALGQEGIAMDGYYYCLHRPEEGCDCRKPRPGLLERAATDLNCDLSDSVMIGDKPSDAVAGRAAGCHTILLRSDGSIIDEEVADKTVNGWTLIPELVAEL